MGGGEGVHAAALHLLNRGWWTKALAVENLVACLAEVFRQEGVEYGVDAGVPVGEAVGRDAEDEGGVRQGECAKLHPHCDDVVGHPADGEGGDHQQYGLGGLAGGEGEQRGRVEKRVWKMICIH